MGQQTGSRNVALPSPAPIPATHAEDAVAQHVGHNQTPATYPAARLWTPGQTPRDPPNNWWGATGS
eukprot:11213056-Lingulodinium_polyedra.AAC.1